MGCHALLQGIISTQELNQDLLHCRQILYQLSHQGSPIFLYTTLNKVDSYHIIVYPDLIIKYTYISIYIFLNLHAKWKANCINHLLITECQRMDEVSGKAGKCIYLCVFIFLYKKVENISIPLLLSFSRRQGHLLRIIRIWKTD